MVVAARDERLLRFGRRLAELNLEPDQQVDALDLRARLIRASLSMARTPATQPFALPREHLLARLDEGVPLLHDQPVQLDLHFASELFNQLVSVLQAGADPHRQLELKLIGRAAAAGRLDPEQLFGEAFVQHPDHLTEIAAHAGVEPVILAALATQATAPLLRAYAAHLLPMVGQPHSAARWQKGYCPICGGWPVLAEGPGLEVDTRLRCGACGSGWRWPRHMCPFCGYDRDSGTRVPDSGGLSISVCASCHTYMKVRRDVDSLPSELVELEDAATRSLDEMAMACGAHRPSGSGFRIELAVPDAEWIEELA